MAKSENFQKKKIYMQINTWGIEKKKIKKKKEK